jgi:hypothetical protein
MYSQIWNFFFWMIATLATTQNWEMKHLGPAEVSFHTLNEWAQ